MARNADTTLLNRIRALNTELVSLELALKAHGDHDARDAVKRAKRELEVVIRQGTFQSRGVNV
jgi:hypothetical protein